MTDIVGTDTLVEGDLPETAANFGSLAAFAAKTETDWTDELANAETVRWGSGGILGGLYEGLEEGKPFMAALIQAIIHKVFEDIADLFDNVDDAFDSMASNFSGKWRDILAAQNSADYANAQLAVMNRLISDVFDSAAGNLSSDWTVSYDGPFGAGGTIQQDGHGNAWWDGFGGIYRIGTAVWNAAVTTTDLQLISTVMPLPVQAPSIGGHSWMRLIGRSDSTADNCVWAEISNDYAAIGYTVSGTDHTLASQSTATANGDTWDFFIGSAADDDEFILKRNQVVVATYTSSSPMKGSAFRSVGFAMRANDRNLFLSQTSPGKLAMFSADDQ